MYLKIMGEKVIQNKQLYSGELIPWNVSFIWTKFSKSFNGHYVEKEYIYSEFQNSIVKMTED